MRCSSVEVAGGSDGSSVDQIGDPGSCLGNPETKIYLSKSEKEFYRFYFNLIYNLLIYKKKHLL